MIDLYRSLIGLTKEYNAMEHKESALQRQCVKWFSLQYPKRTIFAIPNGGKRGKIEAALMQAEGVLAGVADLFVMHGNCDTHGLFIEMKTETGKQTALQNIFEEQAKAEGYKYVICRSLNEFISEVNYYFEQN